MTRTETTADPRRAALYMLAASCSYAAMAATVRVATAASTVGATVLLRSLVIAAVAWTLLRSRGRPIRFTNHRVLLVRSGAGLAAMGCYFWALGNAPLADAITLQYTSPLFVAAFAPFTVKEPLRPAVIGWLAVGFTGVLLVVRPDGDVSWGSVAALASAVLGAIAYLAVRALRSTELPDGIVLHFALFAMLFSSPALLGLVREPPTAPEVAALVAVGLFAAGGQLCMTRAYRYGEAAVVSGFSYVTVALGVVIGGLAFGEPVEVGSVAGAALVTLAGIALARSAPKPQSATSTPGK